MRPIKDIFRSYGVLDDKGRHVNGTDKQTNHNYGDAYESIIHRTFHPSPALGKYEWGRQFVKLMMEVGVADGSSMLAWSEVFPNARCVGMDIHHPSWLGRDKWSDRMEFHLGDQRSHMDCLRAAQGRMFDMIVEDATHILDDSLRTLLYLWRYVRPGGIYVIEEFHNVGELRDNVLALWPQAEVIDTVGPFGGIEPLVVLRKPL